jgi:hypothetical protein
MFSSPSAVFAFLSCGGALVAPQSFLIFGSQGDLVSRVFHPQPGIPHDLGMYNWRPTLIRFLPNLPTPPCTARALDTEGRARRPNQVLQNPVFGVLQNLSGRFYRTPLPTFYRTPLRVRTYCF